MAPPQSRSQTARTAPGSLDEALANGRKLLAEHPDFALKQAQAILAKDKHQTAALRLAAAAHRALGQQKLAERAELVAIDAAKHSPILQQAAKALSTGDFGEASKLAAEYLAKQPEDLAALALSAESAIALGVPDKAIPLLQEVLQRAPEFKHAEFLMVSALMLTDQLDTALAILDRMLAKEPDSIRLLHLKSRLLDGKGDFEQAVETTKRIVDLGPNSAIAWCNHGNALRFCGRRQDAVKAFRGALAVQPNHGKSWWAIADLAPEEISDFDMDTMREELSKLEDGEKDAFNMHVALGLGYHRREQFERAFEHFHAGNASRGIAEEFDPQAFSADVEQHLTKLMETPPPALTDSRSSDQRTPVFIIGMPRAGSTLLERILGEHTGIEALGEMQIIPRMVQRIQNDVGEDGLADEYARLDAAARSHLGGWYESRTRELSRSSAPLFTDKLHMNWRHLGLILRMRPDARIVDIRRNPLDCCWSNFRTLFARGYPAAHDLSSIGHFYREYVRFCDTLREHYPERIHFMEYEQLIDHPERELQSLCSYLDIEFESQMLDYHSSSAPVATASSEQVRQPLNRKGIGVWKPYEPWLGPLRDALGELADE